MHVGSVAIFDGGPLTGPDGRLLIDELRDRVGSRLHLVPRFRQRVHFVPLGQGRPVWVDDDSFDLTYHVRSTALPNPGTEAQLEALMARLQSQPLDRDRPLWEIWFVEGLEGGRVAFIQKTHHCMVDGVSGVDVATVLLDFEPHPPPIETPPWEPEVQPTPLGLLTRALVERATEPTEIVRSVRSAVRQPRALLERVVATTASVGRVASLAPKLPWNAPISRHRRFEIVRVPLDQVKTIKDTLGCTLNDVVLTAVTSALRTFLQRRGEDVDGLTVRAMVPVSVRTDQERNTLGNKVSMMVAELPVGDDDPLERARVVSAGMRHAKGSGQAQGATAIMAASDYAPPTLLGLAARLMARYRAINLVVTNIPGPQVPLYCLGAEMLEAFPYVGPIRGQGLMVPVLSYNRQLGFGLCADRDLLPDLEDLGVDLRAAFDELLALAR